MPTNAKKIRIGGVSHDIEDNQARSDISALKSSVYQTNEIDNVSAVSFEGAEIEEALIGISGKSSLVINHCGKNVIPPSKLTYSSVSYIDGYYVVNRTITQATEMRLFGNWGTASAESFGIASGTYVWSKEVTSIDGGVQCDVIIRVLRAGSSAYELWTEGTPRQISADDKFFVLLYFGIAGTYNCKVGIQIELGAKPTEFEPYTCDQYTVQFPQSVGTVSNGTFEMVSGTLVADSVQYSIDPVNLTLRNGVNTIWTNTDSIQKFVYLSPKDNSFADIENYKETAVTNDLTVGLPILYLTGDISLVSKENEAELEYEYKNNVGSCSIKWQGSSSLAYPKKNFTIKFSNALDVGWGSQKKYNLKANFIDASNALNLCCAKLWAQIVGDRGTNPAITNGANNGAMDGFPCILMLNGKFYGLYTWNTPKDKWTFGMGTDSTEYIVTAETHCDATQFRSTANLDGTDFELEYAADGVSTDTVKTSLNTLISSVVAANASGWESSVANTLDFDSAVDYMIFCALISHGDGIDKNYILTSYNGAKWFFNAYDMDSTFGNGWTGGYYSAAESANTSIGGVASTSKLFYLIKTYNKTELKQRYSALRSSILSESNVLQTFYSFLIRVPDPVVRMENEKWPLKPGTYTNTLARFMDWYRIRCKYIDAEINAL